MRQFFPLLLLTLLSLFACQNTKTPSEAGAAFQFWANARTFPDGKFHTEKYSQGLLMKQAASTLRGERFEDWEALGPHNIGGRTLCLAVHPQDTNIIWMGSAAGGIWKTSTAGRGAMAWEYVETGFPLLGVSSIAINPDNPDILYAGTGEVYNLENALPSVAIRITRGSYGIGIIKSENGGISWQKCLDWSYGDLRGVQDIKLNPLRPETVYAATSEGLLRSYDGGAHWATVHALRMAVDIEINPVDTNVVYVAHGSYGNFSGSGVFRSQDGGNSFVKMTNGLPASFSGKTMLGLSPSSPNTVYASVADAEVQQGLYKTTNGGDTWTLANGTDVCKHQGWYSHDIAVKPGDPNTFIWAGFDTWKSTSGGLNVEQKSYWFLWQFGYVPAGGPEGPPDYVHADIHRVYYDKSDPDKVYLVTDGGLFVSKDGGETFEGRNGGYQTQQFYANLGVSSSNDELLIGGMQDNATAIYSGDLSWTRVLGADGLCAAIQPGNDQVMYGSIQYLSMNKSTDGGQNWFGIGNEINEQAAFNGPFEIAPSNPNIMYAGAKSLWRSDNGGQSWYKVNGVQNNNGYILNIAIHPSDPNRVLFSTYPLTAGGVAKVFKYEGGVATQIQGLPNRYCMDIAWSKAASEEAFAVFGGFNTQHVWLIQDNGQTSLPLDNNSLPDVPASSLLLDEINPGVVYVGNDLGVWATLNLGESWFPLNGAGAPQTMMVMHLNQTPQSRELLVATHGLGLWKTPMLFVGSSKQPQVANPIQSIAPNPTTGSAVLQLQLETSDEISVDLLDMQGRLCWRSANQSLPAGRHSVPLKLDQLPAGTYQVVLRGKRHQGAQSVVKE